MIYTDIDRENDFRWFLDNCDSLYQKYGHKIVAIQNKKVIGLFDDKNSAIDITSQKFEFGTFIVQECAGNESAYTCYITSWELIN